MLAPEVHMWYIPRTDTVSWSNLENAHLFTYSVDTRSWAERAIGVEPRWTEITKSFYLKDGVCCNCGLVHPEHYSDCGIDKIEGPIYDYHSTCPWCLTTTHIHDPDCDLSNGCSQNDFPIMTLEQIELYYRDSRDQTRQLCREIRKRGDTWTEKEEQQYNAMCKWQESLSNEIINRTKISFLRT
jgi:hypothetical protein